MTKRRLIRWSLILVILAAFAVWLEPTRVVWGWLRGEAFYQGRPTSWWAEQIKLWSPPKHSECLADYVANQCKIVFARVRAKPEDSPFVLGFFDIDLVPRQSLLRTSIAKWISLPEPTWPNVLDGDMAARAVLRELHTYQEPHVCQLAWIGLNRLETSERGRVVHLKLKCRVPPTTADIQAAIRDAIGP